MEAFEASLLLATYIEAMAVQAEIEAMKAANSDRERRGEVQAYPEEAFQEKAQYLFALVNQARKQGMR
ncbi:MAG: hypothetical protein WC356_01530 [Candidatus Micrarchaeia archaeon]